MKLVTALLTAVPVPYVRARFHVARAATTADPRNVVWPPRSPESLINEARDKQLMFRLTG